MSLTCTTCEQIAGVFSTWFSSVSADPVELFMDRMVEINHLRRQQCETCGAVLDEIGFYQYNSVHIGFTRELNCWSIWIRRRSRLYSSAIHLIRVGNKPDPYDATGVAVTGGLIDISRIQTWIDQCDRHHGGKCHSILDPWKRIELGVDLILIDVKNRCLIVQQETPDAFRFATLSYVWGNAKDPFQTTKANFKKLCKPGAFDLPAHRERLPRTIAHTMQLISSLGLRFLWVDRFCIVQDEYVEKSRQLAAMAAIYANSYVTIAATEGNDDDYGLPGIGIHRKRPFRQFQFASDCRMMLRLPSGSSLLENSRYHTRGWTFQEWRLSRRLLLFHHQSVSWICYDHSEQENGTPPETNVNPYLDGLNLGRRNAEPYIRKTLDMGTFWTRSPDLRYYLRMIEKYFVRNLTDPEDIIAAFSAIISIQGRSMPGGIFYGIPELFFHTALLWQPSKRDYLSRRENRKGKISTKFPSWSWTAWNGAVNMDFALQASGLAEEQRSGRARFIPIVDFCKVRLSDTPARREPIRHIYGFQPTHVLQTLRKEWLSCEDLLMNVPKVNDPNKVILHTESLYSTVIEFRTRRLFLTLGVACEPLEPDTYFDEPFITDPAGSVVGDLDVTREYFRGQFPIYNAELIAIGITVMHQPGAFPFSKYLDNNCATLCLSRGKDCDWKPSDPLTVFNVLWIEWEGDVAYRRGIGKVWQEFWDNADTEIVDVRLG